MSGGSYQDELVPYRLVGNLNAEQLFPLGNLLIFGWALMAVAPRWKYTPWLVMAQVLFNSTLYALLAVSVFVFPSDGYQAKGDFSSLGGLVELFRDPNAMFVGWVHYWSFDMIVGLLITMDSNSCGSSLLFHYLVIAPILFFTVMLGPLGLTLYAIVRSLFLRNPFRDGTHDYRPVPSAPVG